MSNQIHILCLETSSLICSVSIANEDRSYHVTSDVVQNHAEVLIELINECLLKAGISIKDISAIAISDGPGSYTGLRIGSSTAKGLCFSCGIPLIGISTLKALAWRAAEISDKAYLWPMIDARRMEVYHAIYDRDLQLVSPITNGIIDESGFIPAGTNLNNLVMCGDGARKASEFFKQDYIDIQPDASFLCQLALNAFKNQEFQTLASYEPFYLKSANITGKTK